MPISAEHTIADRDVFYRYVPVVHGLGQAGLTRYGARVPAWLSHHGAMVATLDTGFLAAFTASTMNNMRSTLIGALAIHRARMAGPTRKLMIDANFIGNHPGPNFTLIGSGHTSEAARAGWQEASRRLRQFMQIGLLLTPRMVDDLDRA